MNTEELERRVKQLEEELANERARNERIILELTTQLTEKHNQAQDQLVQRLTGEHREEIKAMLANFKSDVAERLMQLANNQHEQANRITRALQEEKTILGTKEPNRRLAHWYMLTSHGDENERKVRLTSGQRQYIESQHDTLVVNGGHTHHITRQTGNGIDLRNYVRLNANPRIQDLINPNQRNIDHRPRCKKSMRWVWVNGFGITFDTFINIITQTIESFCEINGEFDLNEAPEDEFLMKMIDLFNDLLNEE